MSENSALIIKAMPLTFSLTCGSIASIYAICQAAKDFPDWKKVEIARLFRKWLLGSFGTGYLIFWALTVFWPNKNNIEDIVYATLIVSPFWLVTIFMMMRCEGKFIEAMNKDRDYYFDKRIQVMSLSILSLFVQFCILFYNL